jgi:hypothetical protein
MRVTEEIHPNKVGGLAVGPINWKGERVHYAFNTSLVAFAPENLSLLLQVELDTNLLNLPNAGIATSSPTTTWSVIVW